MKLNRNSSVRSRAFKVGYRATDWLTPVAYRDYRSALGAWSVALIEHKGEPVGAVYTRGPEFHVSVLPGWRGRWATRGMLKEIVPKPRAVTQIVAGREDVGRMLERLGFEPRENGIYTRS